MDTRLSGMRLDRSGLWVPVFAYRETGMTLKRKAIGFAPRNGDAG
jgi:hypothetical protein